MLEPPSVQSPEAAGQVSGQGPYVGEVNSAYWVASSGQGLVYPSALPLMLDQGDESIVAPSESNAL